VGGGRPAFFFARATAFPGCPRRRRALLKSPGLDPPGRPPIRSAEGVGVKTESSWPAPFLPMGRGQPKCTPSRQWWRARQGPRLGLPISMITIHLGHVGFFHPLRSSPRAEFRPRPPCNAPGWPMAGLGGLSARPPGRSQIAVCPITTTDASKVGPANTRADLPRSAVVFCQPSGAQQQATGRNRAQGFTRHATSANTARPPAQVRPTHLAHRFADGADPVAGCARFFPARLSAAEWTEAAEPPRPRSARSIKPSLQLNGKRRIARLGAGGAQIQDNFQEFLAAGGLASARRTPSGNRSPGAGRRSSMTRRREKGGTTERGRG